MTWRRLYAVAVYPIAVQSKYVYSPYVAWSSQDQNRTVRIQRHGLVILGTGSVGEESSEVGNGAYYANADSSLSSSASSSSFLSASSLAVHFHFSVIGSCYHAPGFLTKSSWTSSIIMHVVSRKVSESVASAGVVRAPQCGSQPSDCFEASRPNASDHCDSVSFVATSAVKSRRVAGTQGRREIFVFTVRCPERIWTAAEAVNNRGC